ncbi:30S ribosomal protein S13 [Candidatus Woesearchaeota archaeon]|jgi:small subunit ribosomal protein S13|nr:30S ribosomal protein S13 [Candidatus Woesearchaeota archaeon]MBT6519388.1 30S ribosomal protein S13 [Candidatus Woesearchaeota archaeon]MBT7367499.1 30S ribosomal protein S13 [Candidatus Woesearchaeota archaeon]
MSEEKSNYKHIVRVANADLAGNKPIGHALKKIKGIGFILANAVCYFAKVDWTKKAGNLSTEELERLNDVLKNPAKYNMPTWMLNRRADPETGESFHLLGANLKYQTDNDIKLMRMIKCYKGFRHTAGLPVRGQSTKSNFRNKKGKTSLGVKRKAK